MYRNGKRHIYIVHVKKGESREDKEADIIGTVENSPKDGTIRVPYKRLVVARKTSLPLLLLLLGNIVILRTMKVVGVNRKKMEWKTTTMTKKIMAPIFLRRHYN